MMKLSQIAQILNFSLPTPFPDAEISRLLTDSRSLSFPGESLFFALKTPRGNGHNYIPELYRHQLRFFVVSETAPEAETMPDAVFIRVEDTLQALQQLAAVSRMRFKVPVIGITGSNGKTVVKEWIYQLLHDDLNIVRSPRSYNSQIGVPLSVWGMRDNTQLGVFEAGISQLGEMERLQPIIRPTIGIFTHLGDAHREGFSGLKQKAEEKLKLFKNVETLIFNSDDKLVEIAVIQADFKAELFSWGKKNDARLQVLHIEKKQHTKIELKYQGQFFTVEIPFSDDASIENAMHCICLMLHIGYAFPEICRRMLRLEAVGMRLEVKEGNNGCLIINDAYNSDLNSLEIALDHQQRQALRAKMSHTLILSDILESGYASDELYERVARLVAQKGIKKMIGVGDEISRVAEKFLVSEKHFFRTTDELLRSSLMHRFKHEIILLKGSRRFNFEDVEVRLEQQVHETTLDVDLNAFLHNFNYYRSLLHPDTKVVCMVKAFAYGSGSIEIARILQTHHCDYLAVAVADEGAELRREGIRLPIMVMNPQKSAFDTIFEQKLEPEIYSFKLLDEFILAAEKWGITDYPIHLKIDTGMHRLGFNPHDIAILIQQLQNQNHVKIRSVFSHLAGADNPQFDDFTRTQLDTFLGCADAVTSAFPHKIIRHILNSAGIERFTEYQFDMVRLGIGLYGVSTQEEAVMLSVCTLKTVLLQLQNVKSGDTVGYNRNGKIRCDSRIGVIPVGYADGFDRRLGNGVGEVYVNGHRAKVIGNVCMDLCMVDLTDIPAKEGDSVEIFGKHISVSEVAEKLQTIPYEVLTSVSKRVKRVYFLD